MASRDEILRFIVETAGDKELAALAKELDAVAKAGGAAAPEAEKLIAELGKLSQLNASTRGLLSIKAALADTQNQMGEARAKIEAITSGFVKFDGGLAEAAREVSKLDKQLAALTATEAKQELELKKSEGALAKAGLDTKNLAESQRLLNERTGNTVQQARNLTTGLKAEGDAARRSSEEMRHLGDESQRAGGLFDTVRDNLGKIAIAAGAAAVAMKGVKFVGESLDKSAAIESSLSRVEALAEGTRAQFEHMGEALDAAARDVNVSSEFAASGLVALTQQGRSADDAMKQLVPTLQLAKIAGIDVGTAAGIVATAMDTFGASAGDAAHVVDILVAASKGGKGTLSDMGAELGKLAPLARDLGLSFDQTAAVLGTLVTNGVDAGNASKGLAAIFTDLKNPASQLRQDLFALGDSTGDFGKAVTALTSSGAQGEEAMQRLDAGSRKVILALGQLGPDAVAKFTASLETANGTASRTAKALDDNLTGAVTHFKNALDRLGEGLLAPVLEPLKLEIESLAKSLDEFAATPAFDDLKAAIGDLATEGTKAFDQFIRGIDWKNLIDSARTTLRDAADSFREFGSSVSAIATAVNTTVDGIALAFNTVSTVIHTVASAIAQVIGDVLAAVAKLEEAKAFIGFGAAAEEAAQGARELKDASESFYASAQRNMQQADAAADSAAKNFGKLTERLADVPEAGRAAAEGVRQVGDAAQQAATKTDALTKITSIVPASLRAVVGVVADAAREYGQLGSQSQVAQAAQKAMADASLDHAHKLDAARVAADGARAKLVELARSGDANAEAFRAAQAEYLRTQGELDRLQGKAQGAAVSLDQVKTAASTLGITLASDLQQKATTAESALDSLSASVGENGVALADVRAGFDAWAASARAAVAQADAATQAQTETLIAVKAQMLGISEQAQKTGAAVRATTPDFSAPGDAAKQSYDRAADSARAAGDEAQGIGDKAAAGAEQATTSLTGVAGAVSGMRAQFAATSEAAGLLFDKLIFNDGIKLSAISVGNAFDLMAGRVTRAVQETQRAMDSQRTTLNATVDSLHQFALTGADAFGGGEVAVERMARGVEILQQQIADGAQQFNLLGQEDLGRLQSALEEARQRVQAVQQAAQQAQQELASMADNLQDQLDQIRGKQDDIEQRRFEEDLKRIEEESKIGGEAARAAAEKARKLAQELHEEKLKQIRAQQQAQEDADRQRAQQQQSGSGGGSGGASGGPAKLDFNLNLSGAAGTGGGDLSSQLKNLSGIQKQDLAHVVGPAIIDWLKRQRLLTGGG